MKYISISKTALIAAVLVILTVIPFAAHGAEWIKLDTDEAKKHNAFEAYLYVERGLGVNDTEDYDIVLASILRYSGANNETNSYYVWQVYDGGMTWHDYRNYVGIDNHGVSNTLWQAKRAAERYLLGRRFVLYRSGEAYE